jgi:hypothetical protein
MRDEHFAVGNARVKQGYGACKSAALSAFLKADNRHFFFLLPHPHARRHSPISLWCFFWKTLLTDPIGNIQEPTLRATIAIPGSVSSRQLLFHV